MEPSVQSNNPQKGSILSPKLIILIIIVLVSIIALAYYLTSNKIDLQKPLQQLDSSNSSSPIILAAEQNLAVAQVGQEIIYQSDLDTEIAFQPPSTDSGLRTKMLEKIATDSAILQGAGEIALITLDNSTFNSKTKDYAKRVKLVKEVKEKIEKEADSVSGTVISVWFLNGPVGGLGYEGAKKIALEKISRLQAEVKSGAKTLEQAAEAIRNDSELSKIDPAHKVNASYNFQSSQGESITRDDDFNKAILNLKEGEVTDLLIGVSTDQNGNPIQSHYHFAQVIKRIVNDKILSYEDWLSKVRRKYETTIY